MTAVTHTINLAEGHSGEGIGAFVAESQAHGDTTELPTTDALRDAAPRIRLRRKRERDGWPHHSSKEIGAPEIAP